MLALFTNHPKSGDRVAFNQALCGCTRPGSGYRRGSAPAAAAPSVPTEEHAPVLADGRRPRSDGVAATCSTTSCEHGSRGVLRRPAAAIAQRRAAALDEPVVVTGAALGLPGSDARVRRRDRRPHPARRAVHRRDPDSTFAQAILDKHITRLVKSDDADPVFETIDDADDVIKLAGRAGAFDLVEEFGVPPIASPPSTS